VYTTCNVRVAYGNSIDGCRSAGTVPLSHVLAEYKADTSPHEPAYKYIVFKVLFVNKRFASVEQSSC
jgi:hypothetical protein